MKSFYSCVFFLLYIFFGIPAVLAASLVEIPPPDETTTWEDQEYGIRELSSFTNFDSRGAIERSVNFGQAVLHGAQYTAGTASKKLQHGILSTTFPQFDEQTPIGRTASQGLLVFFHGLNGEPFQWDEHLKRLRAYPLMDVIAPQIPALGNCSLEEASFRKFLDRIVDWTSRNPLKPIAFFGQSNGSRVAVRFETWLREKAPLTPVFVSLTGPLLFGSKSVSMLRQFTPLDAASRFYTNYNVFPDLSYGNDLAKMLLKAARAPLGAGIAKRYYSMYAPFHDHHVYSLGSALPILNPSHEPEKKERHYIVFNFGHNSIASGIVEPQINKCIQWMQKMAKPKDATPTQENPYHALRKSYQRFLATQRSQLASKTIDEFIYRKAVFNDGRTSKENVIHPLMACARGIGEVVQKTMSGLKASITGQQDLTKSDGLMVLLHGLNDGPAQWHRALEELRSFSDDYFGNYTVFTPEIPARGNSDIKTISKPIGELIGDFIMHQGNANKPVILVGTSNGGRLALHLSNIFASLENPIFVASIAGAHFGTETLSKANAMGLGFVTAGKDIQQDLAFGSLHSKETIGAAQMLHSKNTTRAFLFFSSDSDAIVQSIDYHPSHPKIRTTRQNAMNEGPRVKHVHVSAAGHLSIPSAVFLQTLVDIKKWRDSGFIKLSNEVDNLKSCYLAGHFLED